MASSEKIELAAIMQSGGWKSPEMVSRYTARQDARHSGAAKLAVMQNRAQLDPRCSFRPTHPR